MLDADAPNHGPGQFYLNWMVVNVPVSFIGIQVIKMRRKLAHTDKYNSN